MTNKSPRTYLPLSGCEIAIIGMAGRFPGADDLNEFWDVIANARDTISFFDETELDSLGVDPSKFADKSYVRARGVIRDPEYFDAELFGIAPSEAEMMDPQHRIFLEIAWSALENAGYDPDTYGGAIGLYAGAGFNSYLVMKLTTDPSFIHEENALQHLFSNDKDYVATRVSYKLNLRGPSVNVQSACSTSLVATHLACQSLISGESDIALAGGIAVRVPQRAGYWYQRGSIFSPDGHCRAYDAQAAGTVSGNGGGAVVLKRLEDALKDGDHIYATIKSTAINNDGSRKVGFTAPSVEGEASVIATAQAMAEIDPSTLRYIEGHGSGTALGDPIELEALSKVFRTKTDRKQFCAIGSAKANIGHLDTAAGIAGLIRAALSIKHAKIPPSANFTEHNPRIDFANSPFYVPEKICDWPSDAFSRRAGISSFGIGGTNAHLVLEEAPPQQRTEPSGRPRLVVLSAASAAALAARRTDLGEHLAREPSSSLDDVAFTLAAGRTALEHRCAFVASDTSDAVDLLRGEDSRRVFTARARERAPEVIFLFPGQGSQYPGMGRALYEEEPTFRSTVDRCCEILRPELGFDLRAVMFDADREDAEAQARMRSTRIAQTSLFVVEYATTALLRHWGIEPTAMIGHSIGEYVAACVSGVLTLEAALSLVAERGRLMESMEGGVMLSVALGEAALEPLLGGDVALAAVNSPASCVVAGPDSAIAALEERLDARDIVCRRLQTSHAFHSPAMAPAVAPLVARVTQAAPRAPSIPYISNVTGTWVTERETTDAAYWGQHLVGTVRFGEGIEQLATDRNAVFVEVGPGNALVALARQCPAIDHGTPLVSALPHSRDGSSARLHLLSSVGRLWTAGVVPRWAAMCGPEQRARLPLPTYPFQRKRYWLDTGAAGSEQMPLASGESTSERGAPVVGKRHARDLLTAFVAPTNESEWAIAAIWQELFGLEEVGIHDNFFDIGGESMLAIQLVARLQSYFEVELPLAEVLQFPTVAEQSARVREARGSGGRIGGGSPLVRIQPKGSKPPFFCVHPAGGIVHCYIELARLLGKDQPFFALQHPGIDGPCEPYTDFGTMAAHYIEAIRIQQPEGPYHIGGWSFGGTVAFEMAQQLVAQGEEIASLVMMDTPAPTSVYDDTLLRDEFDTSGILTFLGRGIGQIFGSGPSVEPGSLIGLSIDEQFDRMLGDIAVEGGGSANTEARAQLEQIIEMFKVADRAERAYRPSHYEGTVTMLRVSGLDDYEFTGYKDHPGIDQPSFGWDRVSKEVRVQFVPGTHMTLVVNPHVRAVAQELRCTLGAAVLPKVALEID